MERDKDEDLRTKVLLGKDDLILGIKRKGENFYKRVPVELFGDIPGFNFKRSVKIEPGTEKEWRRRDGNNRTNGRKRPLPPIIATREFKVRKEDWSNDIMSGGCNFEKSVTSKPPLGGNWMGGDEDVRTGTVNRSLRKDLSSEISPLEPEKGTHDRDKDESGESNYLLHSRVL